MKFKIDHTKLGNKFFALSNLTEWHFSCRKKYNPIWLEEMGEFSSEEKDALGNFSNILEKYGFSQYLGIPFITENEENAWSGVKRRVKKNEYDMLRKIFEIFEQKFNSIWQPQTLDKSARALRKELNRDCYKKIDKHLEEYFGKPKKIEQVNIYLLKHPAENWNISGGANLKNKGLTIECNELIFPSDASVELAAATIYHELAHMIYQKNFEKKIEKVIEENKVSKNHLVLGRPINEMISELIISALLPKGYLADKYMHYQPHEAAQSKVERYTQAFHQFQQKRPFNFGDLRDYVVFKLHPLTADYIESNKKIDKKYIKTILDYLKNNETG